MNWETAVAYVQSQGEHLRSIPFRPIALNNVGEGQPDIQNEYANNQFLDTGGLPSPVTGARAVYILQRLADRQSPSARRCSKGRHGGNQTESRKLALILHRSL
jgi:hypothetical protein